MSEESKAIGKISEHIERVFDALEMGEEAKSNFSSLLKDLSEVMDFDLVPPKDMEESLNQLKQKIDMDVNYLMGMTMDDIISHSWNLSQMYLFLSQKQAWCEGRSLQLKYAIKLHEAGITWSLSKKAKTLAERIQKGLTNDDKKSIATITSADESRKELYFYHVSRTLKGMMDTIYQQQKILSDRHMKLYAEWRGAQKDRITSRG